MSIRVIIQTDPFSLDRQIKELEGKYTINKICKEFGIDIKETPIAVSVNGEPTTSFRRTIKEKDALVLIKVLPAGKNAGQRIVGGLMIVGGIVLIAATGGAGASFGAMLIFSGVTTLFSPEISSAMLDAMKQDIDTDSITTPTSTNPSYLKGGRNSLGHNKAIPVILGKHRYYPPQVAYPYTEIEVFNDFVDTGTDMNNVDIAKWNEALDTLDYSYRITYHPHTGEAVLPPGSGIMNSLQTLLTALINSSTPQWTDYQILLNAYNTAIEDLAGVNRFFRDKTIDSKNLFLLGAPLSRGYSLTAIANKPVQKLNQVYLWGHKEVVPDQTTFKREETSVDILEGTTQYYNSLQSYGELGKKHVSVGKTLKAYSAQDGFTSIDVILPTNIDSITAVVVFGMFAAKKGDGTSVNPVTGLTYRLYDITSTQTLVKEQSIAITGGDISLQANIEMTAVNIDIDYPIDPEKHYQLSIVREYDDVEAEDCAFYRSDVAWHQTDINFSHVLCTSPVDVMSTEAKNLFNYSSVLSQDEFVEGEIDNFNAIVQTHVMDYDGVGTGPTAWSVRATSNPASMYLYILQGSPNKRPVSDDEIDWDTLEKWHTFCATEQLECNAVLENPGGIENILLMIALTGRATPNNLNKYSVIIEEPRDFPTQLITNSNSFGLTMNRDLSEEVHSIKFSFVNKDVGYQSDVIQMYADGYTPANATKIQSQELVGVTSYEQVQKLGKYMLNCKQRLVETLTVNMDIEYVLCQRGDLVRVSYDQLLLGLARGRVVEVGTSGLDTTTITIDAEVTMEVGKQYAIVVRLSDGQFASEGGTQHIPILNTENTTNVLTLQTPQPTNIQFDNVYSFGESELETGYYTVINVAPADDLSAALTLLNYDENVYSLGTLPPFVSNVSIPSGFGTSPIVDRVYDVDTSYMETANKANNLEDRLAPSIQRSVQTNVPAAQLLRSDALELQISENYVYFVDIDDSFIYRASLLPNATKELIINTPVKDFCVSSDDTLIIYSDIEQNNYLYKKDLNTEAVVQITNVSATEPKLTNNYFVNFINQDDLQKVYRTSIESLEVPEKILDFTVNDFDTYSNSCIWRQQGQNKAYVKNLLDGDPAFEGELFSEKQVGNIIAADPSIWDIQNEEATPFYIDADTQTSLVQSTPFYANIVKHALNKKGQYVFITTDGDMYYVPLVGEQTTEARLNTQLSEDSTTVTGDFTYLGFKINNISVEDIVNFAWGDKVEGTYIQTDTTVKFVGSNYIEVDKYLTGDALAESFTVKGTRLVLDANKVIIPGTVEAGLLAVDAINSKDRVLTGPNAGEHIYSHNLNTGVEVVRNADGDIVRSFDPATGYFIGTDAEFGGELAAGTITAGNNFVVNSDGTIEATGATIDGDLIVNSDVNGRKVEVGTAGVKVTDSGGRIVHDITPSSAVGYDYIGHPYLIEDMRNEQIASALDWGPLSAYTWDLDYTFPDKYYSGVLYINFRVLITGITDYGLLNLDMYNKDGLGTETFITRIQVPHTRISAGPSTTAMYFQASLPVGFDMYDPINELGVNLIRSYVIPQGTGTPTMTAGDMFARGFVKYF